jgi:hypothetical protein
MVELKQKLKDLVIKEYGYEVLDMISSMPYRDAVDYLKTRMEEVKIDYHFDEPVDTTVWGSDLDIFKRRAWIYHTYISEIISYEFGDSLK